MIPSPSLLASSSELKTSLKINSSQTFGEKNKPVNLQKRFAQIYPTGIKPIWEKVVFRSRHLIPYYVGIQRGGRAGGDSGAVGRISGFKWKPDARLDETVFLHFNQQEMELQAIIHTARSLNFSAVAWNIFVSKGIKHVFVCVCVRDHD